MIARLKNNPIALALLGLGLLIVLANTISFVPETRQGVVVQLGQPVRIINAYKSKEQFGDTGAGIALRVPFIESVEWLDKRVLAVDMDEQEVLSTDQLRLRVDAFARYRITDPLKMYKTARTVDRLNDALRPLLGSALRAELGKQTFAALLTPERGEMMDNIRVGLERAAEQYGAEIVDVRIMRADLPQGAALDAAFQRMRTARQQEAGTKRAEGLKQAQIIQANADAEAAKIYAASFGKDADFYDFYRAMQSYRQTFIGPQGQKPEGSTSMILSPGNDYLREFRGRN